MPDNSELLQMQRHFMAALREPIYAESRSKTALPAREGQNSSGFTKTAKEYLTPSATLSPVERLELYHRQYWYRLLDSIAEDFPALQNLLRDPGSDADDHFWRLLEAYLENSPTESYTLRHLGADLPAFIRSNAVEIPNSVHAEELAAIEYALCYSFEAASGVPVPPDEFATAKLTLQPHISLFSLRTPAVELWQATEEEEPLPEISAPAPTADRYAIVYRYRGDQIVEELTEVAFSILSAVKELGSLEAAMTRFASERPDLSPAEAEKLGAEVSQLFAKWTTLSLFIYGDGRRLTHQ